MELVTPIVRFLIMCVAASRGSFHTVVLYFVLGGDGDVSSTTTRIGDTFVTDAIDSRAIRHFVSGIHLQQRTYIS
jgi:hypothetical protein